MVLQSSLPGVSFKEQTCGLCELIARLLFEKPFLRNENSDVWSETRE